MKIQQANLDSDLEYIVEIHMRAFPNFFMTKMGKSFIKEYYQTVLEYTQNISLVATENGQVIGFVVGFADPSSFYQFYRQKYKKLFFLSLLAIIKNPKLIYRVLLNFKKVNRVIADKDDVEMSSLGVNLTNRGIGNLLVKSFIEVAHKKGHKTIYLTTDKENNDGVNYFYKKQGFFLCKTFVSGQRKMNFYKLYITQDIKA